MEKRNLLMIWAKHAFFALALAGTAGVMLPSCEKEPVEKKPIYRAPYEKELFFKPGEADSIATPIVQQYADDTACKKIYLTTKSDCNFARGADFINKYRTIILEPALNVSQKVTGRGAIYIGNDAIYPADSAWYVQNGWTLIRQR
ncbi:MAG: hypothetical protein NC048_07220 [Bacteroides sp.]|nr:hypothetical protein [Ruminococcus flavefaciens]MCM1555270.1 hypothetical protein [Bacteroides sp.]